MGLFELIGALVLWMFSGFKGKSLKHLDGTMNFRLAYIGLGFSLFVVILLILVVRILST
jgi:hypothetical protein